MRELVYHRVMKTDAHPPTSPWLVLSVFAVVVLIWGTTWLGIRISLEYLPPTFSMMIRFIVAGMTVVRPLAEPRAIPSRGELDATPSRLAMVLGGLVVAAVVAFFVAFW